MNVEDVDAVAYSNRWLPRRGWHDDHRVHDRTPSYMPALMQVRAEFAAFIGILQHFNLIGGKCLQLGMGECEASHSAWRALFRHVLTIDWAVIADDQNRIRPGLDTHAAAARAVAKTRAPYDLLFIDAGHKMEDVIADHRDYGPLVRPGGIVAFHDACKRPGYEDEIDVWRYLESLDVHNNLIGTEVGIAWIIV
jgi:hypothetical protein